VRKTIHKQAFVGVILFIAFFSEAELSAEPFFSFDPLFDGAFLASGLASALGSEFLPFSAQGLPSYPDKGSVPAIDGAFMFPYDGTLSKVSDYLQYAAGLSPLLLALLGPDFPLVETGTLAFEALAWTLAAKNAAKYFLPRLRPWAYFPASSVPTEDLEEAWLSFPSGHTAIAFAGASVLAATALLFSEEHPELPWIAAGGAGLACATAALRVTSGSHFLSDVAAGALLGTAIGAGTVLLHVKSSWRLLGGELGSKNSGPQSLKVSPYLSGFLITLSW
jgi:membrane-associated phospholipid phosphatase